MLEVWDTAAVPIEIDQLSTTGTDANDFSIVSPNTPVVLQPGTIHTEIIIQFSPQTFGTSSTLLLIETSDGNITIPLSGDGFGVPHLLGASIPSILERLHREANSIPPSSYIPPVQTQPFIDNIFVAASDTSFAAQFANNILPPITLAPGDSLSVRISFRGLDLTGVKSAGLIATGNLVNSSTCDLIGDDEYGSFTTQPSPTIDFGVMYAGQILDTTIQLINSGLVPLVFDGITGPFAIR